MRISELRAQLRSLEARTAKGADFSKRIEEIRAILEQLEAPADEPKKTKRKRKKKTEG